MAGEIFISYRRADEAWARLLHRELKAEGVEGWYDALIGPGQEWRLATARALEDSKIFVLLFSESAAQSSDIAKELAAATHEKKLVVPVRLQNIEPKGSFLYELASRNWVNAYEDTEVKLSELAKGLAQLVRTGARDESVLPFERGSSASQPSRKSSRKPAIMAAAAIVMAAALAALFWLYPRPEAAVASHPPSPAPSGISVAVLPFLNLSSDKDQEFFSDGITEEITSALAKVTGLAVIGRTSAFQFKGENKDMRAIGEALGAKNLIEGSVRKAGNQVRITVQLIKAADGTHLWTESYDRKLTDIFAVQENIATAIAGALQVPLGLKPGQSLVSNRTADTDSYQDYLRAKTLLNDCRCDEGPVNIATTLLEKVVARDPSYAPGWGLLASAYASAMKFNPNLYIGSPEELRPFVQRTYDRIENAAHSAVHLDPRAGDGYTALGTLEAFRGNWAAGEDHYKEALVLSPNDENALYGYAQLLAQTGRIKDAQRMLSRLLVLDPLVQENRDVFANTLLAYGQTDKAITMIEPKGPSDTLARAYAIAGRYGKAADAILAFPKWPARNVEFRRYWEDAARLMRSAPAKISTPSALPRLYGMMDFVYLFVGAESRSLDFVERGMAANYFDEAMADTWAPPSAAFRKTDGFKTFVRKAHLVEYWRARGWSEFCHPVGADDFACD